MLRPAPLLLAGAACVTNVGIAAFRVPADGPLLGVGVLEAEEGVDLNGDADTLDQVLHLYDRAAATLTNLGIAHETQPSVVGRWLVFAAYELPMETDLNGDGDQEDDVVQVYDSARGSLWSTGLAVRHQALGGSLTSRQVIRGQSLVLQADEGPQGQDLNQDADLGDQVLRSFSLRPPAQQPPLAVQAGGLQSLPGLLAVAGGSSFRFAGEWIVVGFDETEGGHQDLNGDGDSADRSVLHVLQPRTGRIENLHLANLGFSVFEDRVVFQVIEQGQGVDLNGDGDLGERVLHVLDLATLEVVNTGMAGLATHVLGDVLATCVEEVSQGNQDLNGDGDSLDQVLHLFDLDTHAGTNTMLAGLVIGGAGGKFLFPVSEQAQGVVLNGDGDLSDQVLHAVTLVGTVTNLVTAVSGVPPTSGERLATVRVREQNQGADFNFDGDLNDDVLIVYDGALDRFTNTALGVVKSDLVDGGSVAFPVWELWQNVDLNGDGDASDQVLHTFDADTATSTNLALAADSIHCDARGGLLTACVSELMQGVDLNGDGDALDRVLHLIELP